MGIKMTGNWGKLAKISASLPDRLPKAMNNALNREAQLQRGHLIKNITSGGAHAGMPFKHLSPMTLIIRKFRGMGGSKPLIQSGAMRNSVSVVKTPGGGYFIGILRGAPHPSGKGAVNIAALHEFGKTFTVPKTRKMIRFLAAALKSAGQKMGSGDGMVGQPGVLVIRIPARPWIGPTFAKYAQTSDVVDRFWGAVATALSGDLGRLG